jgi:hypothetical protein
LYAHLRNIHGHKNEKDPVSSKKNKPTKELCHICGKGFTNPSNLKRHRINLHNIKDGIVLSSCRIKCPYENCSEYYKNYKELRNHLANKHNIQVQLDEIHFETQSGLN